VAYSTVKSVRQALAPGFALDNPPNPPSNTAADLSNEQLTDAIAEADARINTYIGGRYATPVAADDSGNTPAPVNYWSRDIAAYLALLTWRKTQPVNQQDPVALRAAQALVELTSVRDGKTNLPLPENTSDVGESGGAGDPERPAPGILTFDSGLDPFGSPWPAPAPFEPGHWVSYYGRV
jgi:phage gp36-like protein